MDKQGKIYGKVTFKLILVNQLMTRTYCAPFSSQLRKFQSNPRVLSFSILLMVRMLFLPAASYIFLNLPEASFPIVTVVVSLPKNGHRKEVFIYHHITSRGRGAHRVAPCGGVPVQCVAVLVRAVVSYAARNPALCCRPPSSCRRITSSTTRAGPSRCRCCWCLPS
jgi:hypothetical protein